VNEMKVAVVSPYGLDMPGGVQQQVIELVTWLNRNGHDATVVGPNAERPGVDLGGTIRWHANGAVAPINLSPMQFVRLRRTLSDFDVVHVHEPFMPTIGWAALRGSTPKAATFHADPSTLVRTIYGGLRRTLGRSVALGAVSAVSLTAATVVSEWDPVLIPNGLDVGSYRLDVARTQTQVAFLGRPDHRKGRDIVLAAWPMVTEVVPEARLVVMGDGGGDSRSDVEFAGRVDEARKRRILAESGVFCAPNRGGESFGVTVAEGMAAGCAVVASDIPAFVDLLDGTGLHFANEDVRRLADRLIEVVADVTKQQALAAASTERIGQFDWDVVGEAYVDLYRRAQSV